MRKFSIPYNNDTGLLEELVKEFPEHKDQCTEVYFAIPNQFAGTGRVIGQEDRYEAHVMNILRKAHEQDIESNLLINSGCLGLRMSTPDFTDTILHYIQSLRDSAGLDIVTVADYLLAREIKRTFPELKIECSSIAYVDSIEKAKYWEEIGCDIMVIPPVLNKNLRLIRQLRQHLPTVHLKLVLNQTCLHGCPMWQGHHNLRSHGEEGQQYWDACKNFFAEKPWLLYSSSFIPPRYLDYYDEYIDIYKLVDRKHSTGEILQSFGAYCGDRNYEEKFDELNKRIPEEVFAKVVHCSKNCSDCGYCEAAYTGLLKEPAEQQAE